MPTTLSNWARTAPLAGQATTKFVSPGNFGRPSCGSIRDLPPPNWTSPEEDGKPPLHRIPVADQRGAELDHWTDKQETKATVANLIRDTLWAELPEYYDEVSISGYRQRIYEYVYVGYLEVAYVFKNKGLIFRPGTPPGRTGGCDTPCPP